MKSNSYVQEKIFINPTTYTLENNETKTLNSPLATILITADMLKLPSITMNFKDILPVSSNLVGEVTLNLTLYKKGSEGPQNILTTFNYPLKYIAENSSRIIKMNYHHFESTTNILEGTEYILELTSITNNIPEEVEVTLKGKISLNARPYSKRVI